MAAPAFRSSWQRNWTQSTTGPMSLPSGVETGDVLVAVAVTDVVSVATPSGWSLLTGFPKSTSFTGLRVFAARYDSTGANGVSSAPTLTWGGSNRWNFLFMAAYSGASVPVNVSDAAVSSVESTAPTSPSVTTTAADCRLVWVAATDSGTGPVTMPSGVTVRGTSTGAVGVGDKTQAAAGASGTLAGSVPSAYHWVAGVVALAPLPQVASGSVTVTGAGTITTAGHKAAVGHATVQATGALAASGHKVAGGAVSVSATADVTAAGQKIAAGAAALTATGSLATTGQKTAQGASALTANATATSAGNKTANAATTVTGAATIVVTSGGPRTLPPINRPVTAILDAHPVTATLDAHPVNVAVDAHPVTATLDPNPREVRLDG